MHLFARLTNPAVREAAVFDALRTGTTTTLDVKRHLRDRGYWATQDEVSRRVRRLAEAEGWPWWEMGGFRLYGVPVPGRSDVGAAVHAALVN